VAGGGTGFADVRLKAEMGVRNPPAGRRGRRGGQMIHVMILGWDYLRFGAVKI
jgi:hypothetical protein